MKTASGVAITLGNEQDIDSWMALVERVKSSFPGLETPAALAEHKATVLHFMGRGEALCAKERGRVVGALLFSRESRMLCFLAVEPACRRRHIAETLVTRLLALLPEGDVSVTTYREGAAEGIAARALYQRMGFAPGRLMEEFGAPVQEFVLERQTGARGAAGRE